MREKLDVNQCKNHWVSILNMRMVLNFPSRVHYMCHAIWYTNTINSRQDLSVKKLCIRFVRSDHRCQLFGITTAVNDAHYSTVLQRATMPIFFHQIHYYVQRSTIHIMCHISMAMLTYDSDQRCNISRVLFVISMTTLTLQRSMMHR